MGATSPAEGSGWRRGGLILAGLLVGLFLAEAVLRLGGYAARIRWPCGTSRVVFNAFGFCDRERSVARPSGVRRVLVLGDSRTAGLQVSLDETFTQIMETRLTREMEGQRIEVFNLGHGGYGTGQSYLALKLYGPQFQPDVVVLAFLGENDLQDNSAEISRHPYRPYFSLDVAGELVEHPAGV